MNCISIVEFCMQCRYQAAYFTSKLSLSCFIEFVQTKWTNTKKSSNQVNLVNNTKQSRCCQMYYGDRRFDNTVNHVECRLDLCIIHTLFKGVCNEMLIILYPFSLRILLLPCKIICITIIELFIFYDVFEITCLCITEQHFFIPHCCVLLFVSVTKNIYCFW